VTRVATDQLSAWGRLQALRRRYERVEQLAFFMAGFIFDSVVIHRIDDALVLTQQGAYLIVIGVMLAGLVAWKERTPTLFLWKWLTKVSGPLMHFMLGTLLNAYALFYFKSASGWIAVLFVLVIAGLLLVNELPAFRRLGPVVVYALYSFCLTSYFAYLYPVLIGRLRSWMFLLAVATSLAPLLALSRVHLRVTADRRRVLREALLPSLTVQAALLALFLLRLLPPVPLSLLEIGIYHGVTRDASGSYQLSRQAAPWWKPWASDDVDFRAQAGDRVYCFFRVFAPVKFEDEVRVRWSYREAGRGWLPSDAVPIAVRGGRERGFSGYTYKQNWRPGEWRVAVETSDGREIGRRAFSVRQDDEPPTNRAMTTDIR
jgi:hypothetical protein